MESYSIIKERRKVLRLTQQKLADLSGVSLRTIKLVETEKGNPSMNILSKICNVLELELLIQLKSKKNQDKRLIPKTK
ncbi:helix-turn-helix transcriptional regulator [Parabacteroides pacaensis]|uniref:helix-turn-helix transcriptional regulator n=1 Tax=Parabacteroides pacaensis TaxID=2086575 RepID=UPI000D10930A|nr:helix-turn-helix domain-containing protein [Parabacteroides pacaensis]